MPETMVTIRVETDVKDQFKTYAKKYGGMTPVLLQFIHSFIEQEEEKEQRRHQDQERAHPQ